MNEMLRLTTAIALLSDNLREHIRQAGEQSQDERATHAIDGFRDAWACNLKLAKAANELTQKLLAIEEAENVGSNR